MHEDTAKNAAEQTAAVRRCISVALPVPLFRNFTYSVSSDIAWPIPPGSRVRVAFRNRSVVGVCLGESSPPEGIRLKSIDAVLDSEPSLPHSLLKTARWISNWYAAPLGVTLRAMLPALLTQVRTRESRGAVERVVRIVKDMPSLLLREQTFARSAKQRMVYELLEVHGGETPLATLLVQAQCTAAVVTAMVQKGIVEVIEHTRQRDPFQNRVGTVPPPTPTADQRAAIDRILSGKPGEVFLLHGVTGSGKTLVYIEVLRSILKEPGKTAIVLVPEIALTPQTVDRFRGAFGDSVAVLHSGLSDGERFDAWQSLRRGERRIAVGARSALFAPLEGVGAVIVDEEHEASYKQAETPRYHAREAAIVRARADGAVTILGSATPSLESWDRARSERITLLTLPDRAAGASLPRVVAVDMRVVAEQERMARTPGGRRSPEAGILSGELIDAIEARCNKGEQSLLLLNRRGYSSFVQCDECGDVPKCPHCSISLTYHRVTNSFACHYCQFQRAASLLCENCGQMSLRKRGSGTQHIERLVAERFPTARIARMDLDTTSGKWSHARILDRVGQGEVDILLGTQMIAKGLDFPNVTLVGVVDADVGLNIPDFRASEKTFQLLSQVAGRAGRGLKNGEVIVQTRLPNAEAIKFALSHDYAGFVEYELGTRQLPAYPPLVSLANIVISGEASDEVEAGARAALEWLSHSLERAGITGGGGEGGVELVGPSPCPVERIKDRWRWHFFVKSRDAGLMTRLVRFIAEKCPVGNAASGKPGSLRMVVDRDPSSML